MLKVSVCVPIFNVEKYIEKCAISLLSQTLDDIELIFVDDASPDNSMRILDDAIKNYSQNEGKNCPQTKILRHKKNQGLVLARKTALTVATGEYIIFCDSDDFVHPDMCRLMYEAAKRRSADMVYCQCFFIDEDSKILSSSHYPALSHKILVEKLITAGEYSQIWNKMYKREFAMLYLSVPNTLQIGEDTCANGLMLPYASNIFLLNQPLYYYRITTPSSLTNASNQRKKTLSHIKCLSFLNMVLSPKYKEMNTSTMKSTLISCIRFHKLNGAEYRVLWPEIKKEILHSGKIRDKIVVICCYFSYNLVALIWMICNRIKIFFNV